MKNEKKRSKSFLEIRKYLLEILSGSWFFKIPLLVLGFVSLIWFLIRVIPKPDRAAYPCMQAAFPVASAFVIWFAGMIGSFFLFKKSRDFFKGLKFRKAFAFGLTGLALVGAAVIIDPSNITSAGTNATSAVPAVERNSPNIIETLPASVAIVKSNKALCTEIDYDEILQMVRTAVSMAGGLESLITDGKTVMIKPNLVSTATYRTAEVNGVTTDYRVLQAVVQIVRELNPTGKIILAEGSGGDKPTVSLFPAVKYNLITGIDEIIGFEEKSGNYRDYTSDSLVSVALHDTISLFPDNKKPNLARKIYYNKKYFNADVLISVPTLKNHATAGITGAVKNVGIGATPANIYGTIGDNIKPYLRSTVIDHENEINGYLGKWIHDFYAGRPVDFVIFDGLQGVSSGPGGGGNLTALKLNQQNMRVIIAGKNAISTDAIAGLVIGHDPQITNHLVYLHNDGYGIVDPALIDVKGVQVNTIRKFFLYPTNTSATAKTAFTKAVSSNYTVSGYINSNKLHLSVPNSTDLARMQVWVDNQKINKYVIGGFSDINLDLTSISVTTGEVKVLFEDRYLNTLNKTFVAGNTTGLNTVKSSGSLKLYPNPVSSVLTISFGGEMPGSYKIDVVGINGAIVHSEQYDYHSGSEAVQMNLENLAKGYYVLQMSGPDKKVFTRQFLKN